jgi:hypothetical protein
VGVQLFLGWEIGMPCVRLEGDGKSTRVLHQRSLAMPVPSLPSSASETREQRIEAILQQLRPKVDAAVRKMVERAVDVPEAEEFGAIDLEFRDAGLNLANDVRQASAASRKKRAT